MTPVFFFPAWWVNTPPQLLSPGNSAAEIWSPGCQMRPMNPQGDPTSCHRWSVWRPMNSLGFAENISEWNWTYYSPDALISCVLLYLCLSKTPMSTGSLWSYFNWFHGLGKLLIDRPPRTSTDHPTINHGWSVGRTRILHFPQHCWEQTSVRITWYVSCPATQDGNIMKGYLTNCSFGDVAAFSTI